VLCSSKIVLARSSKTWEKRTDKKIKILFLCFFLGISLKFIKFINNSSSLNKGNHDSDGVWINDLNVTVDFYDFISAVCENISPTLETLFDCISKHQEVHQKYSTTAVIFSNLF